MGYGTVGGWTGVGSYNRNVMRHQNQQSSRFPYSALEMERDEKAENSNKIGFYPFILMEYEICNWLLYIITIALNTGSHIIYYNIICKLVNRKQLGMFIT